jgi:hypothetical protein
LSQLYIHSKETVQRTFVVCVGGRLQILKEQLETKMKKQRAELRKIHESQRRLDNEEMSGEEEEEEEEMTDEGNV